MPLLSLLLLLSSSFAQKPSPLPETEVREVLAHFTRAFENLDWDGFRTAFDDDATVFYPRTFPERVRGRAAFEKKFKIVFEQIRGGKTVPPYMHIEPRGLAIQMLGETAIATFHLDDRAGFLNRRTLVLHKAGAGWKIVHLHASELALPASH